MNARARTLLTFFVLIVILAGMYFFTDWFSRTVGYAAGEEQKTRLAQCLDTKGGILYVSSNCPDCDKQKELIGETALEYLEIVNCDEYAGCSELSGVPAWKISGNMHYGFKDIDELGKISGCELEIEE